MAGFSENAPVIGIEIEQILEKYRVSQGEQSEEEGAGEILNKRARIVCRCGSQRR